MEKLGHKAQKEILENVGQLEKLVITLLFRLFYNTLLISIID